MKTHSSPGELAIRVDPANPDHHLWNNHGTWWTHFTIYPDALTAVRIRKSLKTKCLEEARRRRDDLFAAYTTDAVSRAA